MSSRHEHDPIARPPPRLHPPLPGGPPLTAIKEYQESVPEFIDLQVTKVIKTPVW